MTELKDMVVQKGESVSRQTTIDADNKLVFMFNVSNNRKTGHNYKVQWDFDFSNCTQDEIYALAARSAVIAYRKNFRNVSESSIPNYAHKTIDVHKEIMAVERKTLSDSEKVTNLLDQLSDEEKAAILSQYSAK